MGTISVTNPTDGTTADVADYNNSINTIVTAINGNLDSNNLASNAVIAAKITNGAVTASKLATGAAAATVATSETTSSITFANLATVTDTVTVTIGANGLALVSISSYMTNNTTDGFTLVTFEASGANTIAAADSNAIIWQTQGGNHVVRFGNTVLLTGLAAGSTTFKMKYRVQTGGSGSGTGTFLDRKISVVPL